MENRFENTPPEEKQGWGAYATPPPYPGKKSTPEQANNLPVLPHDATMCDRVREKLPFLMENSDGEMTADTARALYGHLSVCETCSREFDDHHRMAAYLNSVPQVQLPMDFTGAIQRRIQLQAMSPQGEAVVTPATTRAFGTPPAAVQSSGSTRIGKRTLKSNTSVISTLKSANTSKTLNLSLTHLENGLMRRFTTGGITASIMAYFVSSGWGREMLGENIISLRAFLDHIGAVLSRIPIFGRLALLVFTALAQVGDLLGNTYRTVGDMAVRGLAMDIGVCIAAYYFLVVRRQRDSSWIRRA